MEFREEVLSGFCKTLNQTRSVFCEFEREEGSWKLTECDCDYGDCQHSDGCILMGQVKDIENEA